MSEFELRDQIVDYLERIGIMCWKDSKVHQRVLKRGFSKSKGTPDIMGILPGGRFLGIEVKTSTGKVSPSQEFFIDKANSRGALCFVARSLSDVIETINRG